MKQITILALFLILLFSCDTKKEIASVPEHFKGEWTETSEEVTLGIMPAQKLQIDGTNIYHYSEGEQGTDTYKILNILSDSENHLEINCLNEDAIKQIIYVTIKDHFLYAKEWVPNGLSDSGGEYGEQFDLGKYYRKP